MTSSVVSVIEVLSSASQHVVFRVVYCADEFLVTLKRLKVAGHYYCYWRIMWVPCFLGFFLRMMLNNYRLRLDLQC